MVNVAEAYPENVRSMLNEALQHSLLVTKDQRHPMQQECVGMVKEVLAIRSSVPRTTFRRSCLGLQITDSAAGKMPSMKRPAASATGAPIKRQVLDPLMMKCEEIAAMVNVAEAYPENVRSMLNAVLQHSLLVTKDQRQPMQEECVGMVGEVLASVQASLQAKVEALQGKLADSDAARAARENAAGAAAEVVKQKIEATEVARAALGEATACLRNARAAHKAALSEQKSGEEEYSNAEQKKATLEAVSTGDFVSLQQGSGNAKAVQAVLQVAKDFNFDQQLIVAAESALLKLPADRGTFDNIVFEQCEEQFNNHISALSTTMTNCEAVKGDRAAKVESAVAEIAAAEEKEHTCREEFSAAQVASAEAEVACSAAGQA
eukprot:CAMPEP_0115351790 /NCGR_PEP_ID=MMETSP0270-20121206/97171_1 /TAXON_ID=71861 /ORGANISM="Scrippsiella trochoidea, Strain CCMP3099" /LENGTH=376 /DNA_ID=CAMNT_0002773941 /DNA_START=21 /DNA_END=1147 /DNA_ORIENTATION=-